MVTETGSMLDSLFSQISSATVDSQKLELLTNLKLAMGALTRAELTEHMDNLNLEALFACLDSANREQIESTCDILKTLMNILDPILCLEKYHESIMKGFFHPFPEVPALIIAHLSRCIDTSTTSLDTHPAFPLATISQLISDELSTAKQAEAFLHTYSQTPSGSLFLQSPETTQMFQKILTDPSQNINSSKKFRVYECLILISTISADIFNKLNSSLKFMEQLVHLSFKTEDILGQVSAMEIISILVGCAHGQDALKAAGVFEEMKKLGENYETIQFGEILLPNVVKFVGKIGAVKVPPEEMTRLVVDTLLKSGMDFPLKTTSTEALCYVGSTVGGRVYLKGLNEIKACMQQIRQLIMEAPTSYKTRGLEAMARMFGSDEANEDCLPYWFNIIFHDMSELFDIVRVPFPELRLSGLNFLSSIAHLEWAQRHYLRGAGVMEFLISRDPEPVKECVYAKFRLVRIIVDSESAQGILSHEDMAQLKLFVHQGPFYTTAIPTVATSVGP